MGEAEPKEVFLAEKGSCKGQPISVRRIQKRMEHYVKKAGFQVSCHQLRNIVATQLLNAEAKIAEVSTYCRWLI